MVRIIWELAKVIPSVITVPLKAFKTELSAEVYPALLGVGYICGPKIASYMFAGCICVSGKIANFTSMEYRYCICRCGSDDCRDFVRAKLQYRKMEEKVDFLYSSFVFCAGKSESGN